MNEWIGAAIAIVAGVIIGAIASRIVRSFMSRSSVDAVQESAAPVSGLVFSAGFIAGLLVALGFVSSDDLDQLGSDAIAFLPKAIAALIIIVGGNVAATFASAAVAKALVGSGAAARFAPMITKAAIVAGSAIIGAGQLGADTAVINIAVAALLFGLSGSLALLIGLGGRQVASEIAAGRAWRRSLEPGDRVRATGIGGETVEGIVVEVHPTAVELDVGGARIFVPNSKLLDAVVERQRPEPADAEGAIDLT